MTTSQENRARLKKTWPRVTGCHITVYVFWGHLKTLLI